MTVALNLDELATRLTRADPRSAEPEAWAYALREAVALARPDVLLAGWSAQAETAALRDAADEHQDLVDALFDAPPLDETEAVGRALTVVRTLAALYPGAPDIAAVLRGPCSQAAALGADEEAAEVIGDLLAAVSSAYLAAGADLIVIREDLASWKGPLAPVLRALAHHDTRPIVIARDDIDDQGPVQVIVDASVWASDDATFDEACATLRNAAGLVLVPDPLPRDTPLERLASGG